MAKHDIDPVLQHLVHAINESGPTAAPIVVSVHGTVLHGALISEERYFAELVEADPMMSALEPSSGLLGKEYAKGAEAASGLWRISLKAVDGWTLHAGAVDSRGPFARMLGTP